MQTLALNTGLKLDKGRDFVIRKGKLELERDDKYSNGIAGVFEKAGYKTKSDEAKENSFKEVDQIENEKNSILPSQENKIQNSGTNDSLFQRLLGN